MQSQTPDLSTRFHVESRAAAEDAGPSVRKLLLTTDAVGGVWTFCLELVNHLCQQNVHVVLASMGPRPSPAQRRAAQGVAGLTLIEGDYALEWMDDPWSDIDRAADWLLQIESSFKPDVVHLNQYAHGVLPWQAPVVLTGHSCVLSWWRSVHGTDAPQAWAGYKQRVQAGLQHAQVVTAPSRAMLTCLENFYGPLPCPRVIYNGRDGRRFSPGVKRNIIAGMGRLWDDAKNLRALDEACATLPWQTCLLGSTRAPGGADIHFRHATLVGELNADEVALWLSRTAIFCSPAVYEPFGLAVMEAALSGCALVLADIPSFREIWQDAAVYVNPKDPDEIRRALALLIGNPSRRVQLADAAKSRASNFAGSCWAEKYLQSYHDALQLRTPVQEGLQ